jgi:hypothetical protein
VQKYILHNNAIVSIYGSKSWSLDIKAGSQTEGVWGRGAEVNIVTDEELSDKRVEKTI